MLEYRIESLKQEILELEQKIKIAKSELSVNKKAFHEANEYVWIGFLDENDNEIVNANFKRTPIINKISKSDGSFYACDESCVYVGSDTIVKSIAIFPTKDSTEYIVAEVLPYKKRIGQNDIIKFDLFVSSGILELANRM